jgi:TonB family protein
LTAAAPQETWAHSLLDGSPERRRGNVWTVALSSDVRKVVGTLGDDAVPALIQTLESDDEALVAGALWILSQLSGEAARSAYEYWDTPPVPEYQPKPFYPFDAFGKKVEGTVKTHILIGADGAVAHAVVLESKEMLDTSALHCVRRWRFRPAQRDGRPVPSIGVAPITFRIE